MSLLRLAGRLAKLGVWSVDVVDGVPQLVFWSDETCAIHEVPPGQPPSVDKAIDFYLPTYRDAVRHDFERCLVEGRTFDAEYQLVTAKGRRRWVRAIGEAQRDEAGQIVRVSGLFQDITAQKRSEGEVLTLIQTSLDGFFCCDLDGNLLKVNDALCRILDRDRTELLRLSLRDLPLSLRRPPTSSRNPTGGMDSRSGDSEAILSWLRRLRAGTQTRFQLHLRRDNGTYADLEVSCGRLDDVGHRICGFLRDVTAELENKRILNDERRRYQRIFEGVPIAITEEDWSAAIPLAREVRDSEADAQMYWLEHPDELERTLASVRLVDINHAGLRLFGARDKRQVADSLERRHLDPRTADTATRELVALSTGRSTHVTESTLHRLDGREIRAQVRMTFPSLDDPQDGRVFVSVSDITDREVQRQRLEEALAEAERSNADLQQFAYVVSHDLKEPLRTVASFTDLLARHYEDLLDDKAGRYIRFAQDGAQRMQRLIADLLQFSRIQTKAQEPKWVDSGHSLETALLNLGTAIEEAGARVRHGQMPTVLAEPTQLMQLFQNLIGNAVKFRRPDEPCLVDVRARETDGHWEFEIADNGVGIEPRFHDRIFEVFQRLHTRGEYEGTGIGLPICRRIVERHGGTIRVTSSRGKGSVFSFTLARPVQD